MDRIIQRPVTVVELMQNVGVDVLWTPDLPTIRHQVGFTGSAGHLLLRRGAAPVLFVDGRYTLQSAQESPGAERRTIAASFVSEVTQYLKDAGVTRVAFDAATFTYEQWSAARDKAGDALELVPCTANLQTLRMIKTDEELAILRKGIAMATEALEETYAGFMQPGVAETAFAWELEKGMRRRGASKLSFDTLVAAGDHAAIIHAQPGDRAFVSGELALIDFGLVYKGYCTDRTDTVALGSASDELRRMYEAVEEAHDLAIAAIRPGALSHEVDAVARAHIAAAGYGGYFTHGLGHGVGLEIHELPRLSPMTETVLAPGMVVTVEPGVYIEGVGGVRIEDMVLVTPDGCETLTPPRRKGLRTF